MERLSVVHEIAQSSEHKMKLLKQLYYNKYIIKEVPENYIALQKRIAKDEGRGDIEITEELKRQMLITIQNDQKSSLSNWIDYLCSDDAMYPMWFKYYTFTEMLKLGKFDKGTGTFGKRTSTTVDVFVELNPEILAQVYNTLSKEIETEVPTKNEEQAIIKGESFKKLYTFYFRKSGVMEEKAETDGIWVKYEQGDNYVPLWQSLQGKNTGWCTAGEETAKIQLENGDFYVYYTRTENNEYTDPRIAIRMDGKTSISEIRGVGKNQNLESNMVDIANKKLDEFPDKEKYQKKVHDMKLLTEIYNKTDAMQELTEEEIKFLYEIEEAIIGFGYEKDPRIDEIKQKRNNVKDLNVFLAGCKTNYIFLDLSFLKNAEGLEFPETFNGKLNLSGLISAKELKFPKKFKGDFDLRNLTSAEELKLPETINGNLELNGLTSAEGLKLPETINGNLNLGGLTSAKYLILPKNVKGIYLGSLRFCKDLVFSESMVGKIFLLPKCNREVEDFI